RVRQHPPAQRCRAHLPWTQGTRADPIEKNACPSLKAVDSSVRKQSWRLLAIFDVICVPLVLWKPCSVNCSIVILRYSAQRAEWEADKTWISASREKLPLLRAPEAALGVPSQSHWPPSSARWCPRMWRFPPHKRRQHCVPSWGDITPRCNL